MRKDPNIRSPEERYGGEGHAGDDPFAGERAGKKDLPADPSIEVPDASVQDLIQQPDSRPEKLQGGPTNVVPNDGPELRAPKPIDDPDLSSAPWKGEMMDREVAKVRSDRVSGVSNVAYDLMVVLSNHLEGISAIQEYKIDSNDAGDPDVTSAFERVEQRYQESIDELRALLQSRL